MVANKANDFHPSLNLASGNTTIHENSPANLPKNDYNGENLNVKKTTEFQAFQQNDSISIENCVSLIELIILSVQKRESELQVIFRDARRIIDVGNTIAHGCITTEQKIISGTNNIADRVKNLYHFLNKLNDAISEKQEKDNGIFFTLHDSLESNTVGNCTDSKFAKEEHSIRQKDNNYFASAKRIRHVIRQRRKREMYFDSNLFADPAWDILLDLYAAHMEGVQVSVTSLCIAACIPPTTALRWISQMCEAGLLERSNDESDRRRCFIKLTPKSLSAIINYFENLEPVLPSLI